MTQPRPSSSPFVRTVLLIFATSATALVVLVAIVALIATARGDQSTTTSAATSSTTTEAPHPMSRAGILAAARQECGALVQLDWMREEGAVGTPRLVRQWEVTAADPVGSTPGASWRLSAEFAVEMETSRGRRMGWDQTNRCDIEWVNGRHSARLV